MAAVTAADGIRPLSDHAMLNLADGRAEHLLAWRGAQLAGYAQLEPGRDGGTLAEIAADGSAQLAALVRQLRDEAAEPVRVWARGRQSSLGGALTDAGLHPKRVLLQLRRPLDGDLPEPAWPAGVQVRTFVVGQDEQPWLAVNNRAFADHPDQSNWTVADITSREREPWFDPDGFFLAERDGTLVGFHWTKVHPPQGRDAEPIGEVYVIGVDPVMQGQRLGPALTLHGLAYLQRQGLATVKLYVDESNTGAMALYDKLGFREWDADVCYST